MKKINCYWGKKSLDSCRYFSVCFYVFMCKCKHVFVFFAENITCGNVGSDMKLCSLLCVFTVLSVYGRVVFVWKHMRFLPQF